jgi:hypothetical protein
MLRNIGTYELKFFYWPSACFVHHLSRQAWLKVFRSPLMICKLGNDMPPAATCVKLHAGIGQALTATLYSL